MRNESSTPYALIITGLTTRKRQTRRGETSEQAPASHSSTGRPEKKTNRLTLSPYRPGLKCPPVISSNRVLTPRSWMNGQLATERPHARMPDMPRKAQTMLPDPAPAEATIQEHSTDAAESEAVETGQTAHCSLSVLLLVARYLSHGSGPKS